MAIQYSDLVRNAQVDQVETVAGASALLTIRTTTQPANCAAANVGTVLATITLPSNWMNNAAAGSASIAGGPWTDPTGADANGTAGHFRIHNNAGTVCHMQGSVGVGTGDLQVDNAVFATGQAFSITSFTITAGNA